MTKGLFRAAGVYIHRGGSVCCHNILLAAYYAELHTHTHTHTHTLSIHTICIHTYVRIYIPTGNIGKELNDNPDLYISRDGGVSWEQTLAGSWGVNVADHGGLLVAAKDYHQEPSTVLKYSCNEGYNWTDFTFIDVSLEYSSGIPKSGHQWGRKK